MNTSSSAQAQQQSSALIAAFGCYLLWGVLPIYWKLLAHVFAPAVLGYRIIWSLLLTVALLIFLRRLPEVLAIFKQPRLMLRLFITSLLVAANWLIYIWAVGAGMILETSLGYFLLPLLSMLLGIIFLKERPRPLQLFGIGCAVLGVAIQLITMGSVPLVGLGLAFSFGFYGLIRKSTNVDSLPGLAVETALLTPVAIIALIIMGQTMPDPFFGAEAGSQTRLLLIGAGLVTTVPMVAFAYAARRISLITLGIIQYLAPIMAFLLGVFLYKEELRPSMLATFICIWCAIAVYTFDGWLHMRRYTR